MNLNNKKLGMIHLKGINDKAYSKYKAKLDVKPKQSNNLWLQLSIKHTHYDKKQNNQNSNNITVDVHLVLHQEWQALVGVKVKLIKME